MFHSKFWNATINTIIKLRGFRISVLSILLYGKWSELLLKSSSDETFQAKTAINKYRRSNYQRTESHGHVEQKSEVVVDGAYIKDKPIVDYAMQVPYNYIA